jgi:16S rRNA (guanine527-N7)-methyltransferase
VGSGAHRAGSGRAPAVTRVLSSRVSVRRILRSGGCALGIDLSPTQSDLLERYIGLVLSWRGRVNLTGVETEAAAARVLVLDALACVPHLPDRGTVVDLGSGSGTPGVPIAVACPELRVLMVEASRKKAAFLGVVLRDLGLANADALHARAEALGRSSAHRERHDAVTARGVAALPVLAELALPLIKVGGLAVFPKGPGAQQEAVAAAAALRLLGGAAEVRASRLIVVRKVAPTPLAYPRRPGVPARRPLDPARRSQSG